jgi:predicted RNase H-like nuclease
MPHFKDTENKLHFLSEEDIEFGAEKFLPLGSKKIKDSEVKKLQATEIIPDTSVQAQIAEIEASITPRRIREALISTAGKNWLKAANDKIDAIRKTVDAN